MNPGRHAHSITYAMRGDGGQWHHVWTAFRGREGPKPCVCKFCVRTFDRVVTALCILLIVISLSLYAFARLYSHHPWNRHILWPGFPFPFIYWRTLTWYQLHVFLHHNVTWYFAYAVRGEGVFIAVYALRTEGVQKCQNFAYVYLNGPSHQFWTASIVASSLRGSSARTLIGTTQV